MVRDCFTLGSDSCPFGTLTGVQGHPLVVTIFQSKYLYWCLFIQLYYIYIYSTTHTHLYIYVCVCIIYIIQTLYFILTHTHICMERERVSTLPIGTRLLLNVTNFRIYHLINKSAWPRMCSHGRPLKTSCVSGNIFSGF